MPAARGEFQAVLSRQAPTPMERAQAAVLSAPLPALPTYGPAARSCVDPHQHLPLPAEAGLGTALVCSGPC